MATAKKTFSSLLLIVLLAGLVETRNVTFGQSSQINDIQIELNKNPSASLEEIERILVSSAVIELVRRNESALVKKLIEQNIDLEGLRDADGNSLVHIATFSSSFDSLKHLLTSGLPCNEANPSGQTPLSLAAAQNHHEIVDLLLDSGADVNATDEDGLSALHVASIIGNVQLADLLVKNDADLQLANKSGDTPLHIAIEFLNVPMAEFLLQQGADKTANNSKGISPLQLAKNNWEARKTNSKRGYGPEQAVGPPDSPAADVSTAWASQSANGQDEWLIVSFKNSVVPERLELYENCGPGAVTKITMFVDGKEKLAWIGKDPAKVQENGVSISKIHLDPRGSSAKKFKIYIDSTAVPSWNEIDAVELFGQDNSRQWVKRAEASSTYATESLDFTSNLAILKLLDIEIEE